MAHILNDLHKDKNEMIEYVSRNDELSEAIVKRRDKLAAKDPETEEFEVWGYIKETYPDKGDDIVHILKSYNKWALQITYTSKNAFLS